MFLIPTGSNIKCVLKSQMIRLLTFTFPFIEDNDIIITSDVDAFIMKREIVNPLLLPDIKIWIFRYMLTYVTGYSFHMVFIAMKKTFWKQILHYDSSLDEPNIGLIGNGLPKMIFEYGKKMIFDQNTWDIDQQILSHAILESGLCSLPESNNLWKQVNLKSRYVLILNPKLQKYAPYWIF